MRERTGRYALTENYTIKCQKHVNVNIIIFKKKLNTFFLSRITQCNQNITKKEPMLTEE